MLQVLSYSTEQPRNGARSTGTGLTGMQLMSGDMMQFGWGGSRMEQPDPNAVLCQVSACVWAPGSPLTRCAAAGATRGYCTISSHSYTQLVCDSVCSETLHIGRPTRSTSF